MITPNCTIIAKATGGEKKERFKNKLTFWAEPLKTIKKTTLSRAVIVLLQHAELRYLFPVFVALPLSRQLGALTFLAGVFVAT